MCTARPPNLRYLSTIVEATVGGLVDSLVVVVLVVLVVLEYCVRSSRHYMLAASAGRRTGPTLSQRGTERLGHWEAPEHFSFS